MANRYTNISTSEFDPLSFEQIAAPAMMKRQQHDKALASMEANRIKVDPLTQHTEEAIRLKKEMDDRIALQSEQLAREGVNSNTLPSVIKMNREYQDMISPTGRIGQINAAKQVYNTNFKNFMDSAEKQGIGSTQALAKWNRDNLGKYTGYDDDKQTNIKNIGELGVAAKQDYETDRNQAHAILGETITSLKAQGYRFEDGPNGTVMIDKTGNKVSMNNVKQVRDAENAFKVKWQDPNGEGYKYAQDAGLNITPEKIHSDFNAMLKSSVIDNRGQSTQFIRDPKAPIEKGDDSSTIVGTVDPEGTKTIGDKTGTYDFTDIGKPKFDTTGNSTFDMSMGTNQKGRGNYSYKDIITDPIEQKRYEATYNNLVKNGKIHSSRGMNDALAAQEVQKQMVAQGPITLSSRIMRADIDPNANMFMGKKLAGAKDAGARNTLINQDAKIGSRDIIDPQGDGKAIIPKKSFGNGEGDYTLEYVGYDSPFNWRGYQFGNASDQQVMAHKAILYKKVDGKWSNVGTVPVSRTKEERDDPNFKVAKRVNQTYRNMTIAPNSFVPFSNKDPKYKGTDVMYQTKDENGNELPEPLVQIKFPNSNSSTTLSLDGFYKIIEEYELKHK